MAHVTGPVFQLLRGERLALNTITRASGIATAARRVATLAADAGWHGEVAGTRKTTPGAWARRRGRDAPFSVAHAGFPWAARAGFRLAEKYALLVGGASAHRMDLSGMVMLKGAWWAGLEAGGRTGGALAPPTGAPARRQSRLGDGGHSGVGETGEAGRGLLLQDRGGVQVPGGGVRGGAARCCLLRRVARSQPGTLTRQAVHCARAQAEAGADVCMLDNFAPEDLHETARRLKEIHPHVLVEGSGVRACGPRLGGWMTPWAGSRPPPQGIREETISAYFGPHIDVLSLGSLTQGARCAEPPPPLPTKGRGAVAAGASHHPRLRRVLRARLLYEASAPIPHGVSQ